MEGLGARKFPLPLSTADYVNQVLGLWFLTLEVGQQALQFFVL